MASQRFVFGSFVLDAGRERLTRDARPVTVGARGIALLTALLEAGGRAVDKSTLLDAAWPGLVVEESNLSVQIAVLRRLLGPGPDGTAWIETVPRVGYRFVGETASDKPDASADSPAIGAPRASIAVMPFENVSGDAGQDYFADGITDDVITALARFRWFVVASRGTSFAYKTLGKDPKAVGRDLGVSFVLEGSVRRTGLRIRVTSQLVEASNGTTIWSEQYNLEDSEVFALQDAIAERVAGAVEPELLKHDSIRVAEHPGNLTAWDLVRQGTWNFHKVSRATHIEARRLFREACRRDAMLAEAHFWLARVNAGLIAYGWSDDSIVDQQEGLDAALRSIYLDGQNPYAHYSLAIISLYSGRQPQAVLAAERAIELSPSFALGHLVLGTAQLFGGNAAAAIGPLAHGLELNPHDPQNSVWFNLLALARFFAGDTNGALKTVRTALKSRPDSRPLMLTLACCHAAERNWPEARQASQLANELPEGPRDALAPLRQNNPEWDTRLRGLLAQIG
jgi:TolB-like protein